MPRTISIVCLLMVSASATRYCSAQNTHIELPPVVPQSQNLTIGSRPSSAPTGAVNEIQRQQAIAANQQRQLEIRRDTEKMAELTQELKSYLEKNEQGSVVSVDAIKKAEQIEKLAHSVKSKMKQSF
jgi:hypothetical protein